MPVKAPMIDPESDDDRLVNCTSSGAYKRSGTKRQQKPAAKRARASSVPTDPSDNDEDTTKFDIFVVVKMTGAGKRPGSKKEIPAKVQKLPVFPMNATMPFEKLLDHIADKLKTSIQHLPLHTCEWSKKQGAKETSPLFGQSCFDAMKRGCKPYTNHSIYVYIDSPHIASNPPAMLQPDAGNTEWIQGSTMHDEVRVNYAPFHASHIFSDV